MPLQTELKFRYYPSAKKVAVNIELYVLKTFQSYGYGPTKKTLHPLFKRESCPASKYYPQFPLLNFIANNLKRYSKSST